MTKNSDKYNDLHFEQKTQSQKPRGDSDFYFNQFNAVPIGSLSAKLFRDGEHALIGISPFNGYFSYERIRLIIKWTEKHFKNFIIFYPDTISKHTLAPMGYSEQEIKKKVKQKDSNTINKIKRAMIDVGYSDEDINRKIVTFTQIEKHPKYIEFFNIFESKFKTDLEFREMCLEFSKDVLKNNGIDISSSAVDEDKIIESAYYIIKELAFSVDIPTLYNINSSVVIYHDISLSILLNKSKLTACFNRVNQGYVTLNILSTKKILDQILDKIDANIYIKSLDHKYLFANERMLKNTNITEKNDIIGKTDYEFSKINNAGKIIETDKKVFDLKETFYNEETINKNGDDKYFISSKKPLYDEDGGIIGLIGASMDITSIKMAQLKAEEEKRSKQFFINAMSHEMNNYVQAILSASKLLLEISSDSNVKDLSEVINYSAYKLTNLRENLLDFSRALHNVNVELRKEKVDISNLIKKEIDLYNRIGSDSLNGNKIIFNTDEGAITNAFVDKFKIMQVVINLLNNAVKICRDSEIKVCFKSFEKDNTRYISISVEDKGPGIKLDKEEMFNFDKVRYSGNGGLGIGLPICRSIITAHGGDISIKTSDQGTLIEFYFSAE